ncbi:MAG: DUF3800 domain-containing protein [Acidobacteriota bacterium]
MKLCYVDESGNQPSDPCLVMVGILADSLRLHRTHDEFGDIFDEVQGWFVESLREIKGSKMLCGRDRWRKIDPADRKDIAEKFCAWVKERIPAHWSLADVNGDGLIVQGLGRFQVVSRTVSL